MSPRNSASEAPKAQLQSASQPVRSSYISHPLAELPKHDQDYLNTLSALQGNDGMNRFFKTHPSVVDQARDIVSVLDGLDYMNCLPRDSTKEHLVNVFGDYLSRVKAPAADKINANNMIETRLKQGQASLQERDQVLKEIGCGGLFGMADIYVVWFQSHQ
jgi:hypothetical protein